MVITHQMVEYFVDFGEFTLFCLDGNVPAIERIADQLREELDDDMLFSKGEDNIYAIQQKGSKNTFVFLFCSHFNDLPIHRLSPNFYSTIIPSFPALF